MVNFERLMCQYPQPQRYFFAVRKLGFCLCSFFETIKATHFSLFLRILVPQGDEDGEKQKQKYIGHSSQSVLQFKHPSDILSFSEVVHK